MPPAATVELLAMDLTDPPTNHGARTNFVCYPSAGALSNRETRGRGAAGGPGEVRRAGDAQDGRARRRFGSDSDGRTGCVAMRAGADWAAWTCAPPSVGCESADGQSAFCSYNARAARPARPHPSVRPCARFLVFACPCAFPPALLRVSLLPACTHSSHTPTEPSISKKRKAHRTRCPSRLRPPSPSLPSPTATQRLRPPPPPPPRRRARRR